MEGPETEKIDDIQIASLLQIAAPQLHLPGDSVWDNVPDYLFLPGPSWCLPVTRGNSNRGCFDLGCSFLVGYFDIHRRHPRCGNVHRRVLRSPLAAGPDFQSTSFEGP